jgi:hypothetical protein
VTQKKRGELNIFGEVNKIPGDTQQFPQNIKIFSGNKNKNMGSETKIRGG